MLRLWAWTVWREEYSICQLLFLLLLLTCSVFLNLTSASATTTTTAAINDKPLSSWSSYQILEDQGRCSSTSSSKANNVTKNNQRNRSAVCLLTARQYSGTQPLANNDLLPSWTNPELFSVGQRFATRNIGYLGISHFFALIFENFIPDIKDVLLTTGSTSTLQRAVKRYTATATQVMLWYRKSLDIPQEREVLLESLRQVRKLHIDGAIKVTAKLQSNGEDHYLDSRQKDILQELWFQQRIPRSVVFDERFWEALERDLLSSNVPKHKRHFPDWKNISRNPISQFAQTMTQFSFAGLPVLFHKELGISQVTREELRGFIHMWAVLGHALGIKDEFNICMEGNYEESIRLFRDVFEAFFLPAMFKFDWRVRVQLGAYLDALHHMDNMITPRLIMYRFLRDIVKIRPSNMFRQMSAIERMYLAAVDSVFSNNLEANRFLVNQGGMFFLDVNGYDSFGQHYSSDSRKSKGAFYTREKLTF